MKHLFKGLLLFLSLISLTACTTPIKEGHIVDKHMTESHKETNAYMMGDGIPIYSEDKKPAKYYFDVYGEDENGNGHTVTAVVSTESKYLWPETYREEKQICIYHK